MRFREGISKSIISELTGLLTFSSGQQCGQRGKERNVDKRGSKEEMMGKKVDGRRCKGNREVDAKKGGERSNI